MRLPTAPAAVATAVTLAACGVGTNSSAQVRAKVQQFAVAAAARDYRTICQSVLAPSLLEDLARGGIRCDQALRIALGNVKSPRLVIGNVKVTGKSASVLTISQAKGQKSVLSSLRLIETSGGWRIASLGSPVPRG